MRKGKASLRSGATAGGWQDDWARPLRLGRLTETGLYSYHALAGEGADTFQALSASRGWRLALLGTAASGALWLMAPRPAQAGPGGCTTVGTTATCTGDQSAGIGAADFDQSAVDTLNVNSLTANITPAAGTHGIDFYRSNGNVTINSDISPVSISVTGTADGIRAETFVPGSWSSGMVTINHTGDITSAGGFGIHAFTDGFFGSTGIAITSSGTIASYRDGIYARDNLGASIVVTRSGDINSSNGNGIFARSRDGTTSVSSVGNINAAGFGVYAYSSFGATVNSIGDIVAASGIFAESSFSGDVTVSQSGGVSAVYIGIWATSSGSATITHSNGDIISSNSDAIFADASGDINIVSRGNLIAHRYGIIATAGNDLTVNSTGDITASTGAGMSLSAQRAISVTSRGNIHAPGDGINARMSNVFGSGVTVDSTGDITASGGSGIEAGSVAGNVSVTSRGNISAHDYGIDAWSIGNVTVNSTGDVTSLTGSGIYAHGTGNVDVTVNGGTISGANAGVKLDGGGTSTVTVGSTATVTGGLFAIVGGAGNDTANNSGTVTGNVDLGGGTNAFNNLSGGVFNSGATVNLGAGNALTSSGTLAPGGIGTVGTTTLTGNFVQNTSGVFAVDIDRATGTADRLNVSGTANLAGTVAPRLTNIFGPAGQTYTILSAAGGTIGTGLGVLGVQNTAAVTYALSYPNVTDVNLAVTVNFAPSGLMPNEKAVAQNLQQAYLAGGGGLSNLLTYLTTLDFGPFAASLNRLTPEPYLAQSQTALWSGFDFVNSLFSCPVPSSGASLMGEESCYWLRPNGRGASIGGHDGYMGFTERAAGLTGGVQGQLAANWYLDVGAGYERSSIGTDTSSANGDVFHGGAALKYIRDNWLVAGSVSGSLARYDTSRYGIPTAGTATAHADTSTLDLRLRFAYAFGTPALYVKPLVDFDAVGLWRGAINESGAGALNLHVQSQNDWLASAAPAVEIGTQWQQGGYTWRPYVRAGVRFLSKDSFSTTASFEGAPAGIAPFTATSPIDRTLAQVSAGFDVWQGKNFSLRLSYEGRFGSRTSDNGGSLEVRATF
ncbi:autotransporter outer membrane beta-barrel domain-containing protein [Bradyrhizobium sp. USDA 10063]